jgi:hypothetical protein
MIFKLFVLLVILMPAINCMGNDSRDSVAMDSVIENWQQLHPHVIIEGDKVLRNSGKETIATCEKWLS